MYNIFLRIFTTEKVCLPAHTPKAEHVLTRSSHWSRQSLAPPTCLVLPLLNKRILIYSIYLYRVGLDIWHSINILYHRSYIPILIQSNCLRKDRLRNRQIYSVPSISIAWLVIGPKLRTHLSCPPRWNLLLGQSHSQFTVWCRVDQTCILTVVEK